MSIIDQLAERFRKRQEQLRQPEPLIPNRAERRRMGFRGRFVPKTATGHDFIPRYIRRHLTTVAPTTRRQRKAYAKMNRLFAKYR
jgi:hypothetical protein